MHQQFIKIASTCLLAICFCTNSAAQFDINITDYACDGNDYYVEQNHTESIWIEDWTDSTQKADFLSCKVKGRNLLISNVNVKSSYINFDVTPQETGATTLKLKVKTTTGETYKVRKDLVCVELPKLCLELSTSSPDHTFVWLKIRDEQTGRDVSDEYTICVLDYVLQTAAGVQKEQWVINSQQAYFPSISLQEISSRFELGDQLVVSVSLIHKKYNLLHFIAPTTLIIDKLWN